MAHVARVSSRTLILLSYSQIMLCWGTDVRQSYRIFPYLVTAPHCIADRAGEGLGGKIPKLSYNNISHLV